MHLPLFRNRLSEHVQIIPINCEEIEDRKISKKTSVSRIMINSPITTQPQESGSSLGLKPSIPDKPKNIQLIKKLLEDKKSANICLGHEMISPSYQPQSIGRSENHHRPIEKQKNRPHTINLETEDTTPILRGTSKLKNNSVFDLKYVHFTSYVLSIYTNYFLTISVPEIL